MLSDEINEEQISVDILEISTLPSTELNLGFNYISKTVPSIQFLR